MAFLCRLHASGRFFSPLARVAVEEQTTEQVRQVRRVEFFAEKIILIHYSTPTQDNALKFGTSLLIKYRVLNDVLAFSGSI